MREIFRLIRLRTLLFAIFTLYAMRYFVIRPILAVNDFSLQLSDVSFTLLVVAVCCLISGAYVIKIIVVNLSPGNQTTNSHHPQGKGNIAQLQ